VKILLKILEWIGMIIALPLVFLFSVHGMVIVIGIALILISDDADQMDPAELAGRAGAMALLVTLIGFIIKKVRKK
jgi:Mn2+/Fe2+ NRAMP family transporter